MIIRTSRHRFNLPVSLWVSLAVAVVVSVLAFWLPIHGRGDVWCSICGCIAWLWCFAERDKRAATVYEPMIQRIDTFDHRW